MTTFTWTMIIIFSNIGMFAGDIKFLKVPMQNKNACLSASNEVVKKSKRISVVCISSETGEVIIEEAK